MHKTILAGRLQKAIENIAIKTGVDISKSAIGIKAPNAETFRLLQLEKLASELPEMNAEVDVQEILNHISDVKGVGDATLENIRERLLELE